MFESRVSYYNALKGLDLTMGAHGSKPATLIEAAGRRMDSMDVRGMLRVPLDRRNSQGRSGLGHDDSGDLLRELSRRAAKHVKARRSGVRKTVRHAKLRSLSAEEMNELCGACHGLGHRSRK